MTPTWLDTAEYPFRPNFFDNDGTALHYIDEGSGEPILFVHGTPSWSFDYRHVIQKLRTSHRCIAVDHIGFGLSEKPQDYDYSTLRHSQTLERFVLALGLKDITLVVHDFGGPIGLNFAFNHPDRVRRIVILNSWLWSSKNDPDFIRLSRILKSPLLPFLYRYLNFSPRFILPRSFGDRNLTRRLLKQYTKPFANKHQRNGALAFARSLLNDQEWFEALWNRRSALRGKPVLIIWGMKDPVIKPAYLERFIAGFPGATVVRLPTAGHFPQEENPEEVAAALAAFVQGT